VKAIKINGSFPGPILKWREGETVTVAFTNHLRVPAAMKGVLGLSFVGIAPGKTFVYRIPVGGALIISATGGIFIRIVWPNDGPSAHFCPRLRE
jgi:FtsP/CotA-like multicopper oxidase with cupredoxin domain